MLMKQFISLSFVLAIAAPLGLLAETLDELRTTYELAAVEFEAAREATIHKVQTDYNKLLDDYTAFSQARGKLEAVLWAKGERTIFDRADHCGGPRCLASKENCASPGSPPEDPGKCHVEVGIKLHPPQRSISRALGTIGKKADQ